AEQFRASDELYERPVQQAKKSPLALIFPLQGVVNPVSCVLRASSSPMRARVARGGRLVKIEYVIPARPAALANNFQNQNESRKAHTVAACGGNVFHGVRRHVRHGANYLWCRIWARDFDFAVPARAVVLANSIYDR